MGKPYASELQDLELTYHWALKTSIDQLRSFVENSCNYPLIAVGSGGSLTSANMACLLHQNAGKIAKSVTPLDLVSMETFIPNLAILILTAGGRNSDILSAFRFAADIEPRQLGALCTTIKSPLSELSDEYRYSRCFEFDTPSGKDGFLATNSLIATVTILVRAYERILPQRYELTMDLINSTMFNKYIPLLPPVLTCQTLIVLYGGWSHPAAVDLESKFTEAGLGNVQVADYRNFAHGRHHWLAKYGDRTAVIALITPNEQSIAQRTLSILPKQIPVLQLITDQTGPVGGLQLLSYVLHLVYQAGMLKNIDPGRPGVPAFGSRLYKLSAASNYRPTFNLSGTDRSMAQAIKRKTDYIALTKTDPENLIYWKKAYQDYIRRLESTSFGAIVLDYDGTLCDDNERYHGPSEKIIQQLERLLSSGIIVGIATGRGKSVRVNLQQTISECSTA